MAPGGDPDARPVSGGHWWLSRDPDAGTRAYSKGGRTHRAWHGYSNAKMIDHFTGAPLAIHVFPADRNEASEYQTLFEKGVGVVGEDPLSVVGDRGLSVRTVFEFNTLRGVASVFPYRRWGIGAPARPAAGPDWDVHGIPTCKHCHGGTGFVRFNSDGTRARLWFQCALPSKPGCRKVQSISCAHDFARLLPVWRTAESYAAMRESHYDYECVHGHTRARYLVGPDSLANRPKRVSMAGQQLRSDAAMLVEWLRVAVRQGWLDRRSRREEPRPHEPRGMLEKIKATRLHLGLTGGGVPTPTASPP